MKRRIVSVAVLLLCGVVQVQAQEEFERAKEAVKRQLKDPDSARFRNVQYGRKPGTVCGEVNAKSGFGGYTGYQTFVADGRTVVIPKATVEREAGPISPKYPGAWKMYQDMLDQWCGEAWSGE